MAGIWRICKRKGDIENMPTGNAVCLKTRQKNVVTEKTRENAKG